MASTCCSCDSTNAERPGFTGSERLVGEAFRQIIPQREGRVLVASFASNVHRMQQAIDVAVQTGRKVAVVGRSMRKNLNIAGNLGYLDVPDGTLIRPQELEEYQPHEVLILCTGSQGEPMSALTRIAYRDHPTVSVERGDTVIISAQARPRERAARARHDQPALEGRRGGARTRRTRPCTSPGTPTRRRSAPLYGLVRPKAVMPIHGEYRMQAANARMAQEAGVPAASIVLAENGSVVELRPDGVGDRRPRRAGRHVRGRARGRGHRRRRAARPAGTWPRTAC